MLFASKDGFEFLPDLNSKNLKKLMIAVTEKENPEELNDGDLTAPSKRLEQLIPGYDKNKPFYSGIIAEVNTINPIINRCSRFKQWTQKLISNSK